MRRAALALAAVVAAPASGEGLVELSSAHRAMLEGQYASDLFRLVAPVAEVLASRYFHDELDGWGCTYAIVALAGAPPASPPSSGYEGYAWDMGFGEDGWTATLAPSLGDTTRDAIASCEAEWPDGLGDRLRAVLDRPGSYYKRDAIGEDLEVWSAPAGLAAQIRYGD